MFSTKIAFPGGYHGYIHTHGYNVCFIASGIVVVKRHTDAEFCPIDSCNVGMTDLSSTMETLCWTGGGTHQGKPSHKGLKKIQNKKKGLRTC
jgi:hypothetical protein